MICYICKKEFESVGGELICYECDEAAFLCNAMSASFQEWLKTLVLENKFWKGSKIFVKGLINKVDKNLEITEQANNILLSIKEQIIEHLKYYNKDEAIVALLTVKEAARRLIIKSNNSKDFNWGILNDYDIAIKLIDFIINIPKDKFFGAPIGHLENGYSNFISAICLGRIYVILNENYKNIRFLDIKPKNIDEIAFDFIETDDMKKYFDEYLTMGLDDKPEDYKIENEYLRNKIYQEGKAPSQRRNSVNSFTKKEFGFNLDSLELFSKIIFFEEFKDKGEFLDYCADKKIFNEYVPELAIFNKNALKEALQKRFGGDISLDNIINTFSINRFACSPSLRDEIALELMSIYETEELIIMGRIDFSQNTSAFDKFVNSGHYIEMFKPSIKGDKSIKEAQKKLSTYLAYVIADRLYKNGYKLPMEKLPSKMGGGLVPRAEINKIQVNSSNILSQVGDLDVLAIDEKNKSILIFEIKNYKPAISPKDLFCKDKNKIIDEEVLRKIKAREDVIRENSSSVVEYVTGKIENDYKVKSILVTSRPNYYACVENEEVEYIPWTSLIKKIEEIKL